MADPRFSSLNAADARIAESVFEFVQFLLDDDVNLTPAGNLTGAARQKLRARVEEMLSPEQPSASPASDLLNDLEVEL
jgi:hypothetical protein